MKKNIKKIIKLLKQKEYIPIITEVEKEKILKGKVAFISGGSGGIGSAIAKKFIDSGCKVIISGTSAEKLEKISNELGENCKFIVLNLKNNNEYEKVLFNSIDLFGKVDILVNCAGIHTTRNDASFLNFKEEEYDNIMNINLKSVYFLSQCFSNYFIKNNIKGHILLISSSTCFEPAWSPYRLSKWGIRGLTSGMAQELTKFGIVVNSIAPGSTATQMLNYSHGDSIYTEENTNLRYIMPEEIANIALMLVSDTGNMIVGETILASGGRGRTEIR
jgi:NAD(P)-dependent dehydrogenase (short-subunit alcohol dehydrogenase family)